MRFILATNLPNEIIPIYLSCEISFSYFTGIVSGLFLPCRISQGEHEITLMFISRQVFSRSQTPDTACSQTPDTACSQTPVWEHTWIRNSASGKRLLFSFPRQPCGIAWNSCLGIFDEWITKLGLCNQKQGVKLKYGNIIKYPKM